MDGGRAWKVARLRTRPFQEPVQEFWLPPPRCADIVGFRHLVRHEEQQSKKLRVKIEPRPSHAEVLEARLRMQELREYTPMGMIAQMAEVPRSPDIGLHLESELHAFHTASEEFGFQTPPKGKGIRQKSKISEMKTPDYSKTVSSKLLKTPDRTPEVSKILRDVHRAEERRGHSFSSPQHQKSSTFHHSFGSPETMRRSHSASKSHSYNESRRSRPTSAQAQYQPGGSVTGGGGAGSRPSSAMGLSQMTASPSHPHFSQAEKGKFLQTQGLQGPKHYRVGLQLHLGARPLSATRGRVPVTSPLNAQIPKSRPSTPGVDARAVPRPNSAHGKLESRIDGWGIEKYLGDDSSIPLDRSISGIDISGFSPHATVQEIDRSFRFTPSRKEAQAEKKGTDAAGQLSRKYTADYLLRLFVREAVQIPSQSTPATEDEKQEIGSPKLLGALNDGDEMSNKPQDSTGLEKKTWAVHKRAYTAVPRLLQDQSKLKELDEVLSSPHFLVRAIYSGGLSSVLASLSAAVRTLLSAVPHELEAFPALYEPSRGLQRLKQVRQFLVTHEAVLTKQPNRLFSLVVGRGDAAISLLKERVDQCLLQAVNLIRTRAAEYLLEEGEASSNFEETFTLFRYLQMLLNHGCVECFEEEVVKLYYKLRRFVLEKLNSWQKLDPAGMRALPGARDHPFEMFLALADSSQQEPTYTHPWRLELSCRMNDMLSEESRDKLKVSIISECANALKVPADEMEVADLRLTRALIRFKSGKAPGDITEMGMQLSENSPVVCFNRRPNSWESLTLFLSCKDQSCKHYRTFLSSTLLPQIRSLCAKRAVDFDWIDMEDDNSPLPQSLAFKLNDRGSSDNSTMDQQSLLLVIMQEESDSCSIRIDQGIMFLGIPPPDYQTVFTKDEAAFVVCKELWNQVTCRFEMPSGAAYLQEAEMNYQMDLLLRIASCYQPWATRESLLSRITNFVESDTSKPMMKKLYGTHGSGKSTILAKLCMKVATLVPETEVIYFQSAHRHTPDALMQYLCSSSRGDPEDRQNVDHLVGHLHSRLQDHPMLLVLDGISASDEEMLQALMQRPSIVSGGGRLKCVYCMANQDGRHAAFKIQNLEASERLSYLKTRSEDLDIGLDQDTMKLLADKQHGGIPLYLELACQHLAHFQNCVFKQKEMSFQELTKFSHKISEKLAGEIDYLLEDDVFTFLEHLHGREVLRCTLEYLFHEMSGLSCYELWKLLTMHAEKKIRSGSAEPKVLQEESGPGTDDVADASGISTVPRMAVQRLVNDILPFIASRTFVPTQEISMELSIVRRVVARRYFGDFPFSIKETRALLVRTKLAQRVAEEAIKEGPRESPIRIQNEEAKAEQSMANESAEEQQPEPEPEPKALPFMRQFPEKVTEEDDPSAIVADLGPLSRSASTGSAALHDGKALVDKAWTVDESHIGGVLCAQVVTQGELHFVLTGGGDGKLILWDLLRDDVTAENHLEYVKTHQVKPGADTDDLNIKGEAGLRKHLERFSLKPHVRRETRAHGSGVLCLLAMDNVFASGSADRTIKIWDLAEFRCLRTLTGHRDSVSCLVWDGTLLYSGGEDGKVRVWNVSQGDMTGAIDKTQRASVHALALIEEQQRILLGGDRRWNQHMNAIKVFDTVSLDQADELPSRAVQQLSADVKTNEDERETVLTRLKHLTTQSIKTHSPLRTREIQDQLVATKGVSDHITGKIRALKGSIENQKGDVYHRDDIYCMIRVHYKEDGKPRDVLFSGGRGANIHAWDMNSYLSLGTMEDRSGSVDCVKCLQQVRGHLYSAGGAHKGKEGRITVWDIKTRRSITSMFLRHPVMCMTFSGQSLIVGDASGGLTVITGQNEYFSTREVLDAQAHVTGAVMKSVTDDYLKRRGAVQDAIRLSELRDTILDYKKDCSMVTCVITKLASMMGVDDKWDSADGEARAALAILEAVDSYPWFARLVINALDALSRFFKNEKLFKDMSENHLLKDLFTSIKKHHLKHPWVQRTVCLFMYEILANNSVRHDERPDVENPRKEMNKERVNALIKCGGLDCILDAIENHVEDLTVLEYAVPALRIMVVDNQEDCQQVLCEQRLSPLNSLDAILPDLKIFHAMGLKQNIETVDALFGDLGVIQRVYSLKLNGKPVARPIQMLSRFSSLYPRTFSSDFVRGTGKPPHRAMEEYWNEIRQAIALEGRRKQ